MTMEEQLKPGDEITKAVAEVAEAAIADIRSRSFFERNPHLAKMINCCVCDRRHRGPQCKPVYKQMWVDEDVETGELSIQYAVVPLPGQKPTVRCVAGAKAVNKKRKNRHPNRFGLRLVEITRQLEPTVNKERFTTDASRMIEARRQAVNTISNIDERRAKKVRKQQKLSRRINWGLAKKGDRIR